MKYLFLRKYTALIQKKCIIKVGQGKNIFSVKL